MDEQVREKIAKIIDSLFFAKTQIPVEKYADLKEQCIDRIASIMPKPLDVGELLCELEDYITYGYQVGDRWLKVPIDEFRSIAARFCVPDPAAVLKQMWEKLIPTTSPFSDDGYDRAFAAGIRAGINFSKEIIDAKIKELEG